MGNDSQAIFADIPKNEYKDLFQEEFQKELTYVRDITLDSDVEMHLPDEYVSNVQERLNLYTQLDKLDSEQEIQNFQAMLKDRFGRLPKPVLELFEGLRLRWVCKSMGFERLILKNNKLRCYFVENPQSSFYESDIFQQLFQYIATKGGKLQLNIKKNNRHLIVAKDGVHSLKQARLLLTQIKEEALNLS
jgi:transcription-repair coupling factor (superfamily II helicase)